MGLLFRPDDSTPLAEDEDREWFDMESMGLRRYVVRRTASTIGLTIGPVLITFWSAWWLGPAVRRILLSPVIWSSLGIVTLLVGTLAAFHARDAWRSYERRAGIEDAPPPIGRAHVATRRSRRFSLIGALLLTIAFKLQALVGAPWWVLGITGAASVLSWRNVFVGWRALKKLRNQPTSLPESHP